MTRGILKCLLLLTLSLTGCGGDGPPIRKGQGLNQMAGDQGGSSSGTVADVLETREELESQRRSLTARKEEEEREYFILQRVNQRLCERLATLRDQCVPSARLVPDVADRVLACVGNVPQGERLQSVFHVRLQGGGQYKLVADRGYESTPFGDGVTQIQWKPLFNTDVEPPRLLDITDLRLVAITPFLAPLATIQFELTVNGRTVLNRNDLTPPVSGETTFYSLRTFSFQTQRRSEVCRLSPQDIATLKDAGRKEALEQLAARTSASSFGLAAGTAQHSSEVAEHAAKGLFRAVFARYPLLMEGLEDWNTSPLKETKQHLLAGRFENAVSGMLAHPTYLSWFEWEARDEWDTETAAVAVARSYLGLLNRFPTDAELEEGERRMQAGELRKFLVDLTVTSIAENKPLFE